MAINILGTWEQKENKTGNKYVQHSKKCDINHAICVTPNEQKAIID